MHYAQNKVGFPGLTVGLANEFLAVPFTDVRCRRCQSFSKTTVALVHLLSEDRLRLRSFGMLRVSKKNEKSAKKIQKFQFLGGWWCRIYQNLA